MVSLPRGCHCLLSIVPATGAPTVRQLIICSSLGPASAGYTSDPGSTVLGVHPGHGSLPPRVANAAGPIRFYREGGGGARNGG